MKLANRTSAYKKSTQASTGSGYPPESALPLSAVSLKLLAVVTMLIDHIGVSLIENGLLPARLQAAGISSYSASALSELAAAGAAQAAAAQAIRQLYLIDTVLRLIGRISFPLFCFLLVEGFLHTGNLRRYTARLFALSLVSEVPFDLALRGQLLDFSYQNVCWTLLIGLFVMCALSKLEMPAASKDSFPNQGSHPAARPPLLLWPLRLLCIGLACLIAWFLRTDYSFFGVALIALLYLLRRNPSAQLIAGAASCTWEPSAMLAFVAIRFYNGRPGPHAKSLRIFTYCFYPAHLLLLALIRYMLLIPM